MKEITSVCDDNLPRRTHKINITIESNMNLECISSSRVKFIEIEKGLFQVQSSLLFYKCERASFVGRYIRSRLGCNYITGNCSNPSGYFA